MSGKKTWKTDSLGLNNRLKRKAVSIKKNQNNELFLTDEKFKVKKPIANHKTWIIIKQKLQLDPSAFEKIFQGGFKCRPAVYMI